MKINDLLNEHELRRASTDEVADLAENFADGKKPNQLRGKDRARTVKPSTTGSQPHPFKGKLVGNS